jgi:DNA-binding response OmpR family regulator
MRILVVEDDSRIANFVAKGLREQAYAGDVTASTDTTHPKRESTN